MNETAANRAWILRLVIICQYFIAVITTETVPSRNPDVAVMIFDERLYLLIRQSVDAAYVGKAKVCSK